MIVMREIKQINTTFKYHTSIPLIWKSKVIKIPVSCWEIPHTGRRKWTIEWMVKKFFLSWCNLYSSPGTGGGRAHPGHHRHMAGPGCVAPRASPAPASARGVAITAPGAGCNTRVTVER